MYGYIYKTTCLTNNIIYVGQKKSSKYLGQKYLGSGKILKQAIEKYGRNNFKVELLEECSTFEELNQKEIYWIEKFNSTNKDIGYNITTGGQGTPGVDPGYHQGMKGKHQSEYQKQRARESIGKVKQTLNTPEIKQKLSESAKKRTKNRITNGGYIGITKNGKSKMVKEEEVNSYLKQGYTLGIPKSEAGKEKIRKKYSSSSYIHKDNKVKCVDNSLLENYFADGWELGKKPKNQYKSIHHKYF